MTAIKYPAEVKWLPYGGAKRDWKARLRAYWWAAYTAGVIAATVGIYRVAQALF